MSTVGLAAPSSLGGLEEVFLERFRVFWVFFLFEGFGSLGPKRVMKRKTVEGSLFGFVL